MRFLNENLILIKISLKCVSKVSINNKSELVYVISWCRTVQLSSVQFLHERRRGMASISRSCVYVCDPKGERNPI